VPNINELPLNKWDKQQLLTYGAGTTCTGKVLNLIRKKLQDIIKANQFNFWQTYLDNKAALFNWASFLFSKEVKF
jgi:hypothetical protein